MPTEYIEPRVSPTHQHRYQILRDFALRTQHLKNLVTEYLFQALCLKMVLNTLIIQECLRVKRLSVHPNGRVAYRLRHKWRDGTTHVLFETLELIEKLAALVPPPCFNLVRYHGVLAPAARWRPQVVPYDLKKSGSAPHTGCDGKIQRENPNSKDSRKPARCHPKNYSWAELMKRVFEVDVLECSHCGGRMRILCAITPPEAIAKILDCLGLPIRPPPIYSALQDSYPNECQWF